MTRAFFFFALTHYNNHTLHTLHTTLTHTTMTRACFLFALTHYKHNASRRTAIPKLACGPGAIIDHARLSRQDL